MRIIYLFLLVSLFCLVSAKYLPEESASRVVLRKQRSLSDESNISTETSEDDNNDDDDDSIERKRIELQLKLQEKRNKEEQKRLEKERKLQEKIAEQERKLQEKLEKAERKRQEKERKKEEKLIKEEQKRQEKLQKQLEKIERKTIRESTAIVDNSSESAEENDSLDLEDIWQSYVYSKYALSVNSSELDKTAAVNRYLQEELGLNANSTKHEYHQAVLQLIQRNLSNDSAPESGFHNYLVGRLNAVYIQKLTADMETKIAELDNETAILQNVSLPWVTEARQSIDQQKTILQSVVQYLSTLLPNWITVGPFSSSNNETNLGSPVVGVSNLTTISSSDIVVDNTQGNSVVSLPNAVISVNVASTTGSVGEGSSDIISSGVPTGVESDLSISSDSISIIANSSVASPIDAILSASTISTDVTANSVSSDTDVTDPILSIGDALVPITDPVSTNVASLDGQILTQFDVSSIPSINASPDDTIPIDASILATNNVSASETSSVGPTSPNVSPNSVSVPTDTFGASTVSVPTGESTSAANLSDVLVSDTSASIGIGSTTVSDSVTTSSDTVSFDASASTGTNTITADSTMFASGQSNVSSISTNISGSSLIDTVSHDAIPVSNETVPSFTDTALISTDAVPIIETTSTTAASGAIIPETSASVDFQSTTVSYIGSESTANPSGPASPDAGAPVVVSSNTITGNAGIFTADQLNTALTDANVAGSSPINVAALDQAPVLPNVVSIADISVSTDATPVLDDIVSIIDTASATATFTATSSDTSATVDVPFTTVSVSDSATNSSDVGTPDASYSVTISSISSDTVLVETSSSTVPSDAAYPDAIAVVVSTDAVSIGDSANLSDITPTNANDSSPTPVEVTFSDTNISVIMAPINVNTSAVVSSIASSPETNNSGAPTLTSTTVSNDASDVVTSIAESSIVNSAAATIEAVLSNTDTVTNESTSLVTEASIVTSFDAIVIESNAATVEDAGNPIDKDINSVVPNGSIATIAEETSSNAPVVGSDTVPTEATSVPENNITISLIDLASNTEPGNVANTDIIITTGAPQVENANTPSELTSELAGIIPLEAGASVLEVTTQ